MDDRRPKIGVGVFIIRGDKVLVGQRIGSHGANTWSLPGGHLEYGETVTNCARREIEEETGLEIGSVRPIGFTNDIFTNEDKHYVTLFVATDWPGGEAEIREPAKCLEWRWVRWPDVPEPIFLPLKNFLESGQSPYHA